MIFKVFRDTMNDDSRGIVGRSTSRQSGGEPHAGHGVKGAYRLHLLLGMVPLIECGVAAAMANRGIIGIRCGDGSGEGKRWRLNGEGVSS
jgi:hypothetical protein